MADNFEAELDAEGLPVLGVLSQIELRSVWKKEDRVFTPWLARQENLDLLANELGLDPLEKHGTEVPVGRYSADLVCRITNSEEFVLIENQIESSDHKHLGQILTYVVGLDAGGTHIKHVIWVAADFRAEHVEAIKWLNEHLAGKISVFACRVETWRIGNSPPAVKFQVVAQPSSWNAVIRGLDERLPAEGIDANRESYWAAFSEVMRERSLPVKIREQAPRQGFYTFTIDPSKGAYIYVYRVVEAKVIGAYLSLSGVPGVVRVVFDRLIADKTAIEGELGCALDWSEKQADRNYRAQIQWIDGDALDEADWRRQHDWLADQVDKLYRVFKPRI
ncbi:MAG: DUF4268 domain-containing protein, partial [Hyphomicrobium sp.]